MSNDAELASEPFDPGRKSIFWRICRSICYISSILLFEFKAFGVKNIPTTGGALLVSNHQSYLDPVLLGVNLPRPMSYMAKSELFKNRFFAWLIRSLGAFPVKLGRSDKQAIQETIARLREGHLLNLFPEGARTMDGKMGPIQRGAALVVRRANVPIVPAVIDGSFQAWPRSVKMFRPHAIRVLYGKPLEIDGLKSEQIVALIERTLHKMFDDLRAGKVKDYE